MLLLEATYFLGDLTRAGIGILVLFSEGPELVDSWVRAVPVVEGWREEGLSSEEG